MDIGEPNKNKRRRESDGSQEGKSGTQRSRHARSSSRHWFISPLWIAIALEGLIIGALAIWGTVVGEENQAHFAREKGLAETIEEGKKELEGLKWEFNEFKNQRDQICFPNLLALKFDQVMDINKEYVKSGIFMNVGTKNKKELEYKIVLRNNKPGNITPQVEVVFYNSMGNQVGISKIGYGKDDRPSGEVMTAGEVRSFDGVLDLTNLSPPEYVMFKIKDSKEGQ